MKIWDNDLFRNRRQRRCQPQWSDRQSRRAFADVGIPAAAGNFRGAEGDRPISFPAYGPTPNDRPGRDCASNNYVFDTGTVWFNFDNLERECTTTMLSMAGQAQLLRQAYSVRSGAIPSARRATPGQPTTAYTVGNSGRSGQTANGYVYQCTWPELRALRPPVRSVHSADTIRSTRSYRRQRDLDRQCTAQRSGHPNHCQISRSDSKPFATSHHRPVAARNRQPHGPRPRRDEVRNPMKTYSLFTRVGNRLTQRLRRFSSERRGTVIIIVLALLGLLALIGFFALSFTAQENQSATYFANSPTAKTLTQTPGSESVFQRHPAASHHRSRGRRKANRRCRAETRRWSPRCSAAIWPRTTGLAST